MIYIIFDTIASTISPYYFTSLLFGIHHMKLNKLLCSLIFLYIVTENLYLTSIIFIIYLFDYVIFRYINYTLLMALSSFTFYYLIIHNLDISYYINLILVIILYHQKYNKIGDIYDGRKVSKVINN